MEMVLCDYREIMIVEYGDKKYKCFGTLFSKRGQPIDVYQNGFTTFEEVCDYIDEQYDKFKIE